MNRRLTHSVVTKTTHFGAPATISGKDAIWAEPAYTRMDMKMASGTPIPLLAMATPATSPHAAIPIAIGTASPAPSRNIGRLAMASTSARIDATRDLIGTPGSEELSRGLHTQEYPSGVPDEERTPERRHHRARGPR